MTAPDRIRITNYGIEDISGGMNGEPLSLFVGVEYIRADLARTTPLAEALAVPDDVYAYAIDVSGAFDTMMEVEMNPNGAWQVIQALAGHIAALRTIGEGKA